MNPSSEIANKNYGMLIYWSEPDNGFIAKVPELPGCMADGKSYDSVVKNACVAISEWIETASSLGRPIPSSYGKFSFALNNQLK
jgi:predicted RNase H-like HicB family nuclease